MIYKYTELVLWKDGSTSLKEKRVCVESVTYSKRVIKIYWSKRFGSWFYAPREYLSFNTFEIDIERLHLHHRGLKSILDVDLAFASLEVIK